MAFSQQSYTGQGITQQNVVDQSGQNIARGIEAFGEGLSRGIRGRAKAKSQAASLRSKLAPFAEDLAETYGVEPVNWKAFLDDKGLSDLQGVSDGFIVSMAKQLHDKKMASAEMQNKEAERGINQGIAQDAFNVSLLSGQSPAQAGLSALQNTGFVPQGAAEMAMDQRQATAYAQGTDQDFPQGTSLGTMQAIDKRRGDKAQEQRDVTSDALQERNLNSLIDYRDKQGNAIAAQAEAAKIEAQAEVQAAVQRGGLNTDQAKMSMDLFDKLNASQPVKQFGALQSQYSALENLILNKDKLEGPGDISMVFTFMKSLDPNSVVRESEFEVAARAGGLPERFVNEYNKLKDGSFLTDEMRQNFLSAARQAANSYVQSANIERGKYVEQGSRFGLPEEYSGGKPFVLKAKTYASEEEAIAAGESGALRAGEEFFIFRDGTYQPNMLELD
jgi:hypothetical protein